MFDKVKLAVQTVGPVYILMMAWCILTIFANLAGADRVIPSTSGAVTYAGWIAVFVYMMWKRSLSPHRTLVAGLMIGEALLSSGLAVFAGTSYLWAVQFLVDIFWIVGIYVLYTGPSIAQVVRFLRRPTTQPE